MKRRTFLTSAAVASLPVAIGAVVHDPLLTAIEEYRSGCQAFNTRPTLSMGSDEEQDRAVAATYGPPLERLEQWSEPALTHEGALAALRFAREEAESFHCEPSVVAMLGAALGYLETLKV